MKLPGIRLSHYYVFMLLGSASLKQNYSNIKVSFIQNEFNRHNATPMSMILNTVIKYRDGSII
jgi:hypothetical protein